MLYQIAKKILKKTHILVAGAILLGALPVLAVAQSYRTDDTALLPGMVVSLSEKSSSEDPLIKRAGISDARKLVGIATTIDDSLVAVSLANRPIFVVTEGEVDVYAVDTNGAIENGDVLRLSSIRGVVEKSEPDESGIIIGTALASTDFSDATLYETSGEDGASQEVRAEKIPIAINSRALVSAGNVNEKSGLAKLGFSITGKDIGEIRVLIALVIFLLVMVAEGGIIYGAISSAITSLGRNPLARKFIKKELIRVLFVAVLVLAVGIAAIYAVLFA